MTRFPTSLLTNADGESRCTWCGDDPLYIIYHNREWGIPIVEDRELFEKLTLDGFQAGLSWITILRKRENFREAFADFDIDRVARFTKRDVNRILRNPGVIRHRGKIEAAVNNARQAGRLIDEFGALAAYFWRFAPPDAMSARFRRIADIPAKTPESISLSKDLKERGFNFVGPTIIYAFMQAAGLVNDHVIGCSAGPRAEKAQRTLLRSLAGTRNRMQT